MPVVECGLSVENMTCASCVAHVERAARGVPGVSDVRVNLARGRARLTVEDEDAARRAAEAIRDSGYPAALDDAGAGDVEARRLDRQRAHARAWRNRAILGLVLWLPVEALHWALVLAGLHPAWMPWLALATGTAAMLLIGGGFYRGAWAALRRGTTDMDVLIALGASVAYGYSLAALLGNVFGFWEVLPPLYFMEATAILALVSAGHWLEARARDKAGEAIRSLVELAPATATLEDGREVPAHELAVGDRVLVRPGGRVPADGLIVEGRSGVDEALVTGEPLPVARGPGDEVIGGTLAVDGRLIVRVTRVGADTALSQIVDLVERAQASKPPVQKLADRIAAVFVPAVLGIALVTGVSWYIYGTLAGHEQAEIWGDLARAVCSVLIIACPCALGLAVPAAIMVGTGLGARRGVLLRDVDSIQRAEGLRAVALDKTGTVTSGKPRVVSVEGEETLALAAAAEQFSGHPLAKAIVAHAKSEGVAVEMPDDFDDDPGRGVVATLGGEKLLVGSAALLEEHGVEVPEMFTTRHDREGVRAAQPPNSSVAPKDAGCARRTPSRSCLVAGVAEDAATHVHVARGGRYVGRVALADTVKPDSAAAVARLKDMGLHVVLLTGDREPAARAVAAEVGIDEVRAGVRPGGKADVIRELQAEFGTVAMVGDGVNDAPALAAADLGIAMGGGSDVAAETGGVVLTAQSLAGVPAAIRLSGATMRVVRQNLFLAFVYNVLAIPAAAFGLLNPMLAAACMALSDVSVLGNALRLRRAKL